MAALNVRERSISGRPPFEAEVILNGHEHVPVRRKKPVSASGAVDLMGQGKA